MMPTTGRKLARLKEPAILLRKCIIILGMLISLFLVYEHFSSTASEFCDFGEGLDCGIVNKSPYSTLDGITYFLVFDLGINGTRRYFDEVIKVYQQKHQGVQINLAP